MRSGYVLNTDMTIFSSPDQENETSLSLTWYIGYRLCHTRSLNSSRSFLSFAVLIELLFSLLAVSLDTVSL